MESMTFTMAQTEVKMRSLVTLTTKNEGILMSRFSNDLTEKFKNLRKHFYYNHKSYLYFPNMHVLMFM